MKVIIVDKNDYKNNTLIDTVGDSDIIFSNIINLCVNNDFALVDITELSDSDIDYITKENISRGRPKYYVYQCITCGSYIFYDYGLNKVHLDVFEDFPNGFLGTVCSECHENYEDKELAERIRDKVGNKVFEFNDEVYGKVELNES